MQKFSRYAVLATTLALVYPSVGYDSSAVIAQEYTTISDEAQLLYEEAIEKKKKGKMQEAIASYIQALRKDRAVLALDDEGLIEASYDDCVKKLQASPEDVKLLETCGFLASVGFSDNMTAITYYEKIIDLVDDQNIKNRTENLIERLRATAEAQQSYDRAVAAQNRDDRIKAWAEMEKIEDSNEERERANENANRLKNAYSDKEELQNKIPQLEEELKDLQEAYDKADRLWYTLKDELYERRRRRLKNDLAAKKEELSNAKKELKSIESEVKHLEKEEKDYKEKIDSSAFNESSETSEPESEDSVFNEDPSKKKSHRNLPDDAGGSEASDDASDSESSNDGMNSEYEDEYSEEALKKQSEEMSDEERQERLDDLIDNL